jgi:hypothetical protein
MDIDTDDSRSQVDRDASMARGAAIGLEDASAERLEATVKVMLTSYYDGDAARVAAAAALCRARHEESSRAGWDEAASLLDVVLQRLRDAGADQGDAQRTAFVEQLREQMHPEPEPFTWPDRTAPERRWARRAWVHARVRTRHQAPRGSRTHRVLLLSLGRVRVGKLDYEVCDQCRLGYVHKIDVDYSYRGLGLGSRALRIARRSREEYVWHTSPQYPTAGTFWETHRFAADPEAFCPHMRSS